MLNAMALVISLQPFVGMTDGELDWNIADGLSANSSPNVLSELEFKDVKSVGGGFAGSIDWVDSESRWTWFVEGEVAYEGVKRGRMVDTDYFDDNRTNPYSISVSEIVGDDIVDYYGGVGLRYQLIPNRLAVAALFGGFHKEQNFNFESGTQVLADPSFFFPITIDDLNESLMDLDSDYITEWRGNWLALEVEYHWQTVSISTRLRTDDGTYYGEGRWNLRANLQQPRSFVHHANSSGWQFELGVDYHLSQSTALWLKYLRGEWESDVGVDNTYFTDGTVQSTRLNGATWESSQLRVGLAYQF